MKVSTSIYQDIIDKHLINRKIIKYQNEKADEKCTKGTNRA